MKTMGVILLAAATASGGIGKPHVGKVLLRKHAVQYGAPPASGPVVPPGGFGPGGAGGAFGAGAGRRFANTKSQVYFVEPLGMTIGWQSQSGPIDQPVFLPAQLTAPARYNFLQGFIYRLRVSNIAGRPGLNLYPTIEVAPSTPETDAYLTHNAIPVQFTEEDFDQVTAGNFVTKVLYLPDAKYQELAIAGVETVVSTRLEPGVNPVLEADRRGTILMIVRVGAIDLEMPSNGVSGPIMNGVSGPIMNGGMMAPGGSMVPGTMPGGVVAPDGSGMYPGGGYPAGATPPLQGGILYPGGTAPMPGAGIDPNANMAPPPPSVSPEVPLDPAPVSPAAPELSVEEPTPPVPDPGLGEPPVAEPAPPAPGPGR